MDEPTTCGEGLAANAKMPAAVGELIAALGHLLNVHQRALDLTDQNARPEHAAYVTLTLELRAISAQLAAAAERMASSRDLPMGRHDEKEMTGREAFVAFEQFVQSERTLRSLLTASIGEHEPMLEQMRALASGA